MNGLKQANNSFNGTFNISRMYRRLHRHHHLNLKIRKMKQKNKCELERQTGLSLSHQRASITASVFSSTHISTISSISGLCNYNCWHNYNERYFTTSSSCSHQIHNDNETHYDILNVNRTATTADIKEAFLKLSKEYHPDLNKGDPEEDHNKFVSINEAYMVLSKPLSRRDYDLTLQVKKHLRQQSNYPAYRSYGYQDGAPYYHYRNHSHVDWDGTSQSSSQADENVQSRNNLGFNILMNFSLTIVFTIGFIVLLMGSVDYVLPSVPRKTVLRNQNDLNEKDFVMTSIQEGQTVVYYAVKDDENSEVVKVHAFFKKEVEGNPSEYVLEELNSFKSL